MKPQSRNDKGPFVVAGYVRRSSIMQRDNLSSDAQKRKIQEACAQRGLPDPIFYEDDLLSAHTDQIAKRPAFRQLLDDVEAGLVQMVVVHSFDRWARNVMITLQTLRILGDQRVPFLSLSDPIDYSTPQGVLNLTIVAAFAQFFSEMLAKHTAKGKEERAAQGLPNGDTPFGYKRTGPKTPPEKDQKNFEGLRLIGELAMQGRSAEQIADAVNAAGYRTGSKRYGDRLFTKDTIAAILRNDFYRAFASEDDRGIICYKDKRFRGQHEAAFTVDEWELIRSGSGMNQQAPHRAERARRVYEFAGFIADIHCGLPLRCGGSGDGRNLYYRDVAKLRQLPCPVGESLLVRVDVAREQFGAFLQGITLPEDWQEAVHQRVVENLKQNSAFSEQLIRERERLKNKRAKLLKQHADGYLTDKQLQMQIAEVDLALMNVQIPEGYGLTLNDIITAGKHLPEIATLWQVATTEERREMVTLLLEPEGLYYDLELEVIAAIKPRPAFLPIFRLAPGLEEYEEANRTLVTSDWRQRNRRASEHSERYAVTLSRVASTVDWD